MDEAIAPADVVACVRADFPVSEVDMVLARLAAATRQPRLQRCIVFAARGHRRHFDYLCRLVGVDERDVIFGAEYADPQIRLYDFSRPIPSARIDDRWAGD